MHKRFKKNSQTIHHLEFKLNSDVHNYNTRRENNIRLPKVNTNWGGKQRTKYRAVKEWNNLLDELKQLVEISDVFLKMNFLRF